MQAITVGTYYTEVLYGLVFSVDLRCQVFEASFPALLNKIEQLACSYGRRHLSRHTNLAPLIAFQSFSYWVGYPRSWLATGFMGAIEDLLQNDSWSCYITGIAYFNIAAYELDVVRLLFPRVQTLTISNRDTPVLPSCFSDVQSWTSRRYASFDLQM